MGSSRGGGCVVLLVQGRARGCVDPVVQGRARGCGDPVVQGRTRGCGVGMTCALRNVTMNAPGLTPFAVATTGLRADPDGRPDAPIRTARALVSQTMLGHGLVGHDLHDYTECCMVIHSHRCAAPIRTVGSPCRSVCLTLPVRARPTKGVFFDLLARSAGTTCHDSSGSNTVRLAGSPGATGRP